MYNMFSPIPLNLEQSPGRQLLFDSGYDTRLSTYFSPDGDNLSDSPQIRSMFQAAIGRQNIEAKLNRLAKNKKVIASIDEMNRVIRSGKRGDFEVSDFMHNDLIDKIFTDARKKAWAEIKNMPRVVSLIDQSRLMKIERYKKKKQTQNIQPILNMYK